MIDQIFGIFWAQPNNGVFFIAIGAMIALLLFAAVRVRVFMQKLVHPDHQPLLIKNFSWQRYVVKSVLVAGALLLMGIALLQPQWDREDEMVTHHGRDVIVALDISRSMLAQDCSPNRLECAKQKIKKLIDMLAAERVGLLVFSGAAVMQCPLTTDRQAFAMFLDALSVETISSGTTSYMAALEKVLEAFSVFAPERTKLALLCTDGEDFSANLAAVQAKLADAGVRVCTFGVATEQGAPIPLYDDQHRQQGFQKDEQGRVVVSRLHKNLMQQIARDTKGISVIVAPDDSDVLQVQKWIDSFEKTTWDERSVQRLQDKYFYYTGVAWLLLLLEFLL